MERLTTVLSQGAGTILGLLAFAVVLWVLVSDITQKKHTILRNYPLVGHLRYLFERQGEYFRQYFFANDREEMPFDRATRAWVYRTAKGEGGIVGFGSTKDLREPGAMVFVNAAFPPLDEECLPTPPLAIGDGFCARPFLARSIVNVSGMSFGALSAPAVEALSQGAAAAGCWMCTGEGGLSPHHLVGGCDLVMQIGTAKYGLRDADGNLSPDRARAVAEQVNAFELKLSQGAKPGKGGVLPAGKVTPEIAAIRGIPVHVDSLSPNRHRDIATIGELLDAIARVRDLTGRPVGVKTAIGGRGLMDELCDTVLRRGLQYAPDFLTIDGGEGGSGASPQTLADHMSLPIDEALPLAVDALLAAGLKERVKVVASGKLVTPARVAWALCAGADAVNTARGFMFALGCVQAMRCHNNTCPTGIATQNPRLQRGLVVADKCVRVASYARTLAREVEMIAHSCGLRHARALRREHVRIVQAPGRSVLLSELWPYPVRPQRGEERAASLTAGLAA
jgi:glutamate synthase domain-containing protein 2